MRLARLDVTVGIAKLEQTNKNGPKLAPPVKAADSLVLRPAPCRDSPSFLS